MSTKKQIKPCKDPRARIGDLLKDGVTKKCAIPCDKLKRPDKSKRCTAELGEKEAGRIAGQNIVMKEYQKYITSRNKTIRNNDQTNANEKIKQYKEKGRILFKTSKEEQDKTFKTIQKQIDKLDKQIDKLEDKKDIEKKGDDARFFKGLVDKSSFGYRSGEQFITRKNVRDMKLDDKISELEKQKLDKSLELNNIRQGLKEAENRKTATLKAKETRARNKKK